MTLSDRYTNDGTSREPPQTRRPGFDSSELRGTPLPFDLRRMLGEFKAFPFADDQMLIEVSEMTEEQRMAELAELIEDVRMQITEGRFTCSTPEECERVLKTWVSGYRRVYEGLPSDHVEAKVELIQRFGEDSDMTPDEIAAEIEKIRRYYGKA